MGARFDNVGGSRTEPTRARPEQPLAVSDHERALLVDIAAQPIAGITARYSRLGWHPMTGNAIKDRIITKGLAAFENVPTATARIKILTLTPGGMQYLEEHGISLPAGRRGGAAHEYWRQSIRQLLERHGYQTAEEFPIPNGGAVDLHATKDDHHVYVEIETGKSDIPANIAKCEGLPGTLIFFFLTGDLRKTWQDELGGALALTPADLDQVRRLLR